ncbi:MULTISPECIES: hypothetical protein [Mucilaginibacter]|nr:MULTISPECIES: hypothetical protein [Mucilaginibacter]
MKKITTYLKLILACALLHLTVPTAARPLSSDQPTVGEENIVRFIKIWGLVKYRFNSECRGEIQCRQRVFALYPLVKDASEPQFNSSMLAFTEQYASGIVNSGSHTARITSGQRLTLNKDHAWINDPALGLLLQKKLKQLVNTYNLGSKHHYMNNVFYEGDLPNEPAYADYRFREEAMNFLSLASESCS